MAAFRQKLSAATVCRSCLKVAIYYKLQGWLSVFFCPLTSLVCSSSLRTPTWVTERVKKIGGVRILHFITVGSSLDYNALRRVESEQSVATILLRPPTSSNMRFHKLQRAREQYSMAETTALQLCRTWTPNDDSLSSLVLARFTILTQRWTTATAW